MAKRREGMLCFICLEPAALVRLSNSCCVNKADIDSTLATKHPGIPFFSWKKSFFYWSPPLHRKTKIQWVLESIEDLKAKLASKENTAAAAELKEPVDPQEESQTFCVSTSSSSLCSIISVLSTDDEEREEEEEDMTESAEVGEGQEESQTPPSPNLLSVFDSVGEDEDIGLLMFSSSESESDSDSKLAMWEE